MPTVVKRGKAVSVAKRLRQAASVAINGGGPLVKKRRTAAGPTVSEARAKSKKQQLLQLQARRAAVDAEEVTSESDEEGVSPAAAAAGFGDVDGDVDDSLETPQEARVRLAQRLIGELKAREAERLGFGEDSEEDEGEEAAVTGAVSARLQAANLRRTGRLRTSLANSVAVDGAEVETSAARNWHRLTVTCAQLGSRALFTAGKDGSLARWSLRAEDDCRLRREAHVPGGLRPRRRHAASKSAKATAAAAAAAAAAASSEVLHRGHVLCMALSADQTRLATGDADGLILVWDATQLRRLHEFRGHRGAVTALAFRRTAGSGSGVHLFSGSHDKTVRHWGLGGAVDCGLGFIEALFGHSSAVLGLDSMRLERCLSCGGADRSLRLWKLAEESQLVFELPPGGGQNSCESVAMVTEQVFASGQGDGSICLWSAQKKRPTCRVPAAHGPDRWVTALAAVKNSDLLASGSWDGRVRLWRISAPASLAPLLDLPAPGFVNQLTFSPVSVDEEEEEGSDGRLRLAAALGQEHKWGRWLVDKSARNVCLVWRLSDGRAGPGPDGDGTAAGLVTVDPL